MYKKERNMYSIFTKKKNVRKQPRNEIRIDVVEFQEDEGGVPNDGSVRILDSVDITGSYG